MKLYRFLGVDHIFIGVDLGATNLRIAIGDKNGLIKKIQEHTEKSRGPTGLIDQIINIIHSLVPDFYGIEGIGIGCIGPVDVKKGVILIAPNLPFDNIPLREPISEEFDVPINILNDCSSAVLGEVMFGLGKGIDNLVYITLSSGIGCGAYVDGKIVLGKDGNATEMGHSVIDMDGKLTCGCGVKGHWEAYCSGKNIPNYVKLWVKENNAERDYKRSLLYKTSNKKLDNVTTKMIYGAAKKSDEMCIKIVKEIGRMNAIGFANVISAYDPELITIGGSIALNNPNLVIRPITKYLREYSIHRLPRIEITPLGHDIVLYGAIGMNLI